MRNLTENLKNRKIILSKLIDYGFIEKKGYTYKDDLLNSQFEMIVNYDQNQFTSYVLDKENHEEYVLVDVIKANGEFVGKLKEEYQKKLEDIISYCSVPDVYKSEYTKKVIEYVRERYEDELEFLWKSSPYNSIFRHKKTKKWYAAILRISAKKIGLESDEVIEIIDLKCPQDKIEKLVDGKCYFGGYHMNKKHWITIKLDGSVPLKTIYEFIDASYQM